METGKSKNKHKKSPLLLGESFYTRGDVVEIARDLLGKFLVTKVNCCITSGMITETEAYAGVNDKASHAFGGRRTARTEIMYRKGGTAYIYLCYGVHSLFNIVTNIEGIPHAILIRSIVPTDGIGMMMQRTGLDPLPDNAGTGPGKVSRLLGIHFTQSGLNMTAGAGNKDISIWIEDRGNVITSEKILVTERIGVGYSGKDALLPYRFVLKQ